MKLTAYILIILLLIGNVCIRPEIVFELTQSIDWVNYVYFYGNIYCLILAAIIPLFFTKNIDKAIAWSVLLVMVNNGIDSIYFDLLKYEYTDVFTTIAAAAIPAVYYLLNRQTAKLDLASIFLLSIIPIKLLTSNTDMMIGDKYLRAIGDAACYFLIALYTLNKLIDNNVIVVGMFFTATLYNFYKSALGDTKHFHWSSVFVAAIALIFLTWYELRKRYARTDESKKLFRHIAYSLILLLIGTGVMLFLYFR